MLRRGAIFALVLVLTGAHAEWLQAAGETAFISREFDQWPSTAAQGSAAAASLDPLTGLWANPSSLAFSPGQVGATHTEWIADTRMEQLALALGGSSRLRFGISTQLVTTDDIGLRSGPTPQPLGLFEARDFGLGLSAGYRLDSAFSVGVTTRLMTQQVHTDNASSMGFDLGAMWQQSSRLRVGVSVNNLGNRLAWNDSISAPLPRSFRAGGSVLLTQTLEVSGDVWMIRDRDARGAAGIQWQPTPALAVRAGYLAGVDSRNVSVGFGLNWREVGFDYALVPMANDLGTTHRIALRFVPSLRQ